MKNSILKRYPTLTENDVSLRDDGKGIYIDVWNCDQPKPTMEQISLWITEDSFTSSPSVEEKLIQMEQDVADLWYSVMMGGLA